MGHHEFAAILGELCQAAAVDVQKLDDLLQPALDLAVHFLGRQVDEGGRQPRQQGLEAQTLVQQFEQAQTVVVPLCGHDSLPLTQCGAERREWLLVYASLLHLDVLGVP